MDNKNNIFPSLFDGILNKNVVTTLGFGIPLVIGTSVNLKSAILVCILMFAVNLLISLPIGMINNLPRGVRPPIAAIGAMGVIHLLSLKLGYFSKEFSELGFYITLIAVNSILIENINPDPSSKIGTRVSDVTSQTFGFSLIMIIMAVIREFLSKRTIWDLSIGKTTAILRIYSSQTVFMGFLILGLLIVGLRLFKIIIVRLSNAAKSTKIQTPIKKRKEM